MVLDVVHYGIRNVMAEVAADTSGNDIGSSLHRGCGAFRAISELVENSFMLGYRLAATPSRQGQADHHRETPADEFIVSLIGSAYRAEWRLRSTFFAPGEKTMDSRA